MEQLTGESAMEVIIGPDDAFQELENILQTENRPSSYCRCMKVVYPVENFARMHPISISS